MNNIMMPANLATNSTIPTRSSLSTNALDSAMNAGMKRKAHQLTERLLMDKDSISRMQRMLILLRHASKCPHSAGEGGSSCPGNTHCASMKKLWKHISSCRQNGHGNESKSCKYPNCSRSRYALWHFKNCADLGSCPVCGPVRMILAKQAAAIENEKAKLHPTANFDFAGTAVNEDKPQDFTEAAAPIESSAESKRQKGDETVGNDKATLFPSNDMISARPRTPMSHPSVKRACVHFLRGLQAHEHGWVFSEPVDPLLLNVPDYFEVIQEPMDLGTIEKRLECGEYRFFEDFQVDTLLIFNNALQYNQDDSEVHTMAKAMKKKCMSDFSEATKLLM
jgi:hypothetical protein